MFHRRLIFIAGLIALAMLVPVVRLGDLALRKGDAYRADAERRLRTERWLPTVRGRIIDRKGVVLAEDRPSFQIAVDYEVITGAWIDRRAAASARREHRAQWAELSAEQRAERIDQQRPAFAKALEDSWDELAQLSGVPREQLDEERRRVTIRVERMAQAVWRQRKSALDEQRLARGLELLTDEDRRPIREEVTPHVIVAEVPDRIGFAILRRLSEQRTQAQEQSATTNQLVGVHIRDGGRRVNPFESAELVIDRSTFPSPIASNAPLPVTVRDPMRQLVGGMRDRPYEEDDAREPTITTAPDGRQIRNRRAYQSNDHVGNHGIERTQEHRLRGLRGLVEQRLDTGETITLDPEPGRDVRLAIDAVLQARLHALLDPSLGFTTVQHYHQNQHVELGAPLAASVAVLDVDTGEVLALASWPSQADDVYTAWNSVHEQQTPTWLARTRNRAISSNAPPGSIVKPLIIVAAATENVYNPAAERIPCTGHFLPNQPNVLRCWIYRERYSLATHDMQLGHSPSAAEAVMTSCNITFYELARRLGSARIINWYRRFGVGTIPSTDPRVDPASDTTQPSDTARFDLGLDLFNAGSIPDNPRSLALADTIMLGIGQGPVTWTPLHAANAYATLFRSGRLIDPRVILNDPDRPARHGNIPMDPTAVEHAIEGLRRSQEESLGTTNHITITPPIIDGMPAPVPRRERIFNAAGVRVWAKSGTAQTSPLLGDHDDDPVTPDVVVRRGDHAWCVVVCAPEDRPYANRYAIAVLVEYGGSGGRVAGPIANQVIHALADEGYLPAPTRRERPRQHIPPTPEFDA